MAVFAFTYAIGAKKNLINYVRNQEEHHRTVPYLEELIALLKEHGIEFDERYLDWQEHVIIYLTDPRIASVAIDGQSLRGCLEGLLIF